MKARLAKWMGLGALVVVIAACGDEPAANNGSPNAGNNAVDPDAGGNSNSNMGNGGNSTDPDAGNNSTTPDTCTPITECSAEECGTVDDGCGGTVQCETACVCQDGIAQEITCGTCGLGVVVCSENETGPGTCEIPEIPDSTSVEAACDSAVLYVSTTAADGGDGSIGTPFNTLSEALASASSGDVVAVHAPEADPIAEAVELVDGVSVFGGYNEDLELEPGGYAFVRPPVTAGEDVYGFRGQNLGDTVVLYGLDIVAPDASQGRSSYGGIVDRVQDLRVFNSTIVGGDGGVGEAGNDGQDGGQGSAGEDAARSLSIDRGLYCIPNTQNSGDGGTNAACPGSDGGEGGNAATEFALGLTPAQAGESTAAAMGGTPGSGTVGNQGGGNGEDAPAVADADDGSGGVAGGMVSTDGFWVPTGDGSVGVDGQSGGGGGGGGGSWFEGDSRAGSVVATKGGGGGAGGCGGEGGGAGGAGGASFGLFVVDSELLIRASEVLAGGGGVGGDGGIGGSGGDGGLGGRGTSLSTVCKGGNGTLPWTSGNGGDGAAGASGGEGGGGAGGDSIGIFCQQGRVDLEDSGDDAVLIAPGSRGPGGGGGTPPGQSGREEAVNGCNTI